MEINKVVDIGAHAAIGPYMNDGGLEDIVRAALEATGRLIAAQALRDAEVMLCMRMAASRERGEARVLLTERANELAPPED